MKETAQGSQHSDICHLFPDFLWLLRDVTLELPKNKKTKQPMTPREFMLEVVFKKNKKVGNALESFSTVDCRILPTPDDASLQGRSPDSVFTQEVQKFIAYIYDHARAKNGFHEGGRVDGPVLVMLVSSYLEAINNSAKPCLENSWQSVVHVRCSQVTAQLVKEYEAEMQKKLNKFPMEVAVSDENPKQPSLMQIHGDILRRMLDKLREATKYYMPADPSASEIERKELSDQLTGEIMQTKQPKEGSKTTGKVVGGVLHRFMEENEKMSHDHCVKVFGEVSRPVYDCIKRAESHPTATDSLKDIMQKEMEQLQEEYSKKAVGPAKEKVLELKLKELKEYGSKIAWFQLKEKMPKANLKRKINYTLDDKKKIVKVWFDISYTPSIDTIKGECERLNLGTYFLGDKKKVDNWIVHFADKLFRKELVMLKKTYNIEESDVVVYRM